MNLNTRQVAPGILKSYVIMYPVNITIIAFIDTSSNRSLNEFMGLCMGDLNGKYWAQWDNGSRLREAFYIQGKLHGIVREWYYNDTLRYEAQYDSGKVDGVVMEYDQDGYPKHMSTFRKGKLEGAYKEWGTKRQVTFYQYFRDNKIREQCFYTEDARIQKRLLYDSIHRLPFLTQEWDSNG